MCRIRYVLAAVALGLALAGSASAQNLVTNGGFETGDFTGWTQSGNTGFTGVNGKNPHSGSSAAFLGPIGSLGFLSQNLTTVPGSVYKLDYWFFSDGGTPNEFRVSWDGTILSDHLDIPAQPYTEYTFSVRASTLSTPLQFGFQDNPGFLYLDDVSVTDPGPGVVATFDGVVPEPSSMVLAVLGLAGVGFFALRKRAKVA